jgi:hypothetical protein
MRPLPDRIEGTVVDVERVHLTPDVRERLRFLSHLSLYSDIVFVELNLGHVLSNETKKSFQKELSKRKQARTNRVILEKRCDEKARKVEEERINELKARMQRVDPDDEFFRSPQDADAIATVLTGDEFGPVMARGTNRATALPHYNPSTSFSAIARTGGTVTAVNADDTNFPVLDASIPPKHRVAAGAWRPPYPAPQAPTTNPAGTGGGKKPKGKRVLLFSTSAHKAGMY